MAHPPRATGCRCVRGRDSVGGPIRAPAGVIGPVRIALGPSAERRRARTQSTGLQHFRPRRLLVRQRPPREQFDAHHACGNRHQRRCRPLAWPRLTEFPRWCALGRAPDLAGELQPSSVPAPGRLPCCGQPALRGIQGRRVRARTSVGHLCASGRGRRRTPQL
ncbi:hypothetical protein BDZ91DRAFT_738230 [Kalaharituber pfeilii]|nr:hypothetical protein BDZ91DRAFT_738230 [Kalaharituber pfeilii]